MSVQAVLNRVIATGITWDGEAAALFERRFAELSAREGMSEAAARQEAQWQVDLMVCRRFVRKQIDRALACRTAAEKRALVAEWQREHGASRSSYLIKLLKDDKALEAIKAW